MCNKCDLVEKIIGDQLVWYTAKGITALEAKDYGRATIIFNGLIGVAEALEEYTINKFSETFDRTRRSTLEDAIIVLTKIKEEVATEFDEAFDMADIIHTVTQELFGD